MSWIDILKEIKVQPESELEHLDEWVSAQEKGYPSILTRLSIVANYNDETGELDAYTSYKDFGKFYFVGNSKNITKIKGAYGKSLKYRNNKLGSSKPKITLLNPKDGTTLEHMENGVFNNNGIRINSFSQVDDIMDEATYKELNILPMYRYPPLKEDE
tara:strand:+ start:118 stop:591 length:474 start_codon:yes stop_codon:yes gene_type:complete